MIRDCCDSPTFAAHRPDCPSTPTQPMHAVVLDAVGITKPARDLIDLADQSYREGYDEGYLDGYRDGENEATPSPLRWWHFVLIFVFAVAAGYGVLVTGIWLWLAP